MNNIEEQKVFQYDEQVEELGLVQRIIGVIFYPERVMRNLVARPRIALSFIILTLIAVIPFIFLFDTMKPLLIAQFEQQFLQSGQELTESMLNTMVNWSLIGGIIAGPIVLIGGWLIGGLILTGIVRLFKGTGSIKTYFSITGYANIIMILSAVITVIMGLGTGEYSKDAPSITSLASFIDPEKVSVVIYSIASQIELFSLWTYAIIGIGVSYASGLSKQKSYGIVILIFIAKVVLSSLFVWASVQLASSVGYY